MRLAILLLAACASPPTPDKQILAFQVDGRAGPAMVAEIADALGGVTGDGRTRQAAFFINGISLDASDAEIRATIDDAFTTAERYNLAVGFHVDDSMGWGRRTDLTSVIDNVEWVDWNKTPAPERTWGVGGFKLGAPQICYESPAMRAEIYRIAKDVIAAEIATHDPDRFAGVIMGWETRLDGVGTAGMVTAQTGYCSLTQRGFSAANPPSDFTHELEVVVQRWADRWCQGLVDGGLARDQVFTHMPFMSDPAQATQEYAPPWTAVNDHAIPGYTGYADAFDDEVAALAANPRFAIAEGTNVSGPQDKLVVNPMPWSSYLGRLFDHHAVLVNIFGWGAPGYGDATQSADAFAAYRAFLSTR